MSKDSSHMVQRNLGIKNKAYPGMYVVVDESSRYPQVPQSSKRGQDTRRQQRHVMAMRRQATRDCLYMVVRNGRQKQAPTTKLHCSILDLEQWIRALRELG